MRRYDEEVYLPREVLPVLIGSPFLSLMGKLFDTPALSGSLYKGNGFFLLVCTPYSGDPSFEIFYEDEIEDLKDFLISELQDTHALGVNETSERLEKLLRRVNQSTDDYFDI